MEHENFRISIDGVEADDLYPDLAGLEVELDEELAGMFRVELPIFLRSDGAWTHLDDERLAVWREVEIEAGFAGAVDPLIAGYITHVRPSFGPDPTTGRLEIWGLDASVLLDREEVLKDWPNKKDSDIATEIVTGHGLAAEVEDTQVIHDEAVSTVIQRETDMQFLRRLARRNGFECYAEGRTVHFRPPRVDAPSQPVLAFNFGGQTNLVRFALEVDALTPANVAMFQVDRTTKEVLEATADRSRQPALGERDAAGLLVAGMSPAEVFVAMNTATGAPEMEAICRSVFHQAEWFVTGEGVVAANDYGHVLLPRRPVTIKGLGETHSGVYYVTHVTHSFGASGYAQLFRVKRNGLLPTGDEDFAAGGGLLGGLL
jgi:phage protein D